MDYHQRYVGEESSFAAVYCFGLKDVGIDIGLNNIGKTIYIRSVTDFILVSRVCEHCLDPV